MATRADMMLMQALSQFGSGLGSMMGRKRQNKRNAALAEQMFPMQPDVPQVDPKIMKLAGAMGGAVPQAQGAPGIGAISGMGMQGAVANRNQQAQGAVDRSNAQATQMRELMKDPQAAAMLKQQHIASMMPKPPKVTSVSGGYVVQKGNDVEFMETDKDGKLKDRYLIFGDSVLDLENLDENGSPNEVFRAPPGTKITEVGKGDQKIKVLVDEATGDIIKELGEGYDFGKSELTTVNPGALKGPALRGVQGGLMKLEDSQANYQRIMDSFDEKYLTYPDKVWRGLQSELDKSGAERIFGQILSDESWAEYGKATTFKSNTWNAVNAHIKMITGAQMSEKEVKRILRSIANTEDSPRAFLHKMNATMGAANDTHKRMEQYLTDGVLPQGYEMKGIEAYEKYSKMYDHETASKLAKRDAVQAWGNDQIMGSLQTSAPYAVDEDSDYESVAGEPEPYDNG